MNRWKVISPRLLAAGLTLLFALGCASPHAGAGVGVAPDHRPGTRVAQRQGPPPHAPAHGYRDKHLYRYYPAREVYFHMGRRVYFYLEGQVWKASVSLPYHLQISLGDYVRVEMYSDTPYEYHAKHAGDKNRKVPPGQAKKK
jgi:hypothetical protein